MRNFKKYDIWIQGMEIVKSVYLIAKELPKEELFGLRSQIKKLSFQTANQKIKNKTKSLVKKPEARSQEPEAFLHSITNINFKKQKNHIFTDHTRKK